MAAAKLTLSAEKPLIEDAKRMAGERNTSVSAMFSRFLRAMKVVSSDAPPALGPITRRASGMVRLPDGRSDRKLMEEALSERHGARR